MLVNFAPTSINIGWDNVTQVVQAQLDVKECVELLRRAPSLEYCKVYDLGEYTSDHTVDFNTVILHPRLRSLNSEDDANNFLGAINVPSLQEWTHSMYNDQHGYVTMISLLDCSNCFLDGGSNFPEDLYTSLQAMPSLERLYLSFDWKFEDIAIMDDILTRPPTTTSVQLKAPHQSHFSHTFDFWIVELTAQPFLHLFGIVSLNSIIRVTCVH